MASDWNECTMLEMVGVTGLLAGVVLGHQGGVGVLYDQGSAGLLCLVVRLRAALWVCLWATGSQWSTSWLGIKRCASWMGWPGTRGRAAHSGCWGLHVHHDQQGPWGVE